MMCHFSKKHSASKVSNGTSLTVKGNLHSENINFDGSLNYFPPIWKNIKVSFDNQQKIHQITEIVVLSE